MVILPAIDMYDGKAVRLYKGDYQQMTVYDEHPVHTTKKFRETGARWIHLVDLQGARDGGTPNMETALEILNDTGLKAEIGGGIRSMDVIRSYIDAGFSRVILGTAAVTNQDLVAQAAKAYGEKIAVGADIKDGFVAIKGWKETSRYTLDDFCSQMANLGVRTIICTDVSRDGAMNGTNRQMYQQLTAKFPTMNFVASGGVSSLEDVQALKDMGMYGAIIGKAYYTGAIDLKKALQLAGDSVDQQSGSGNRRTNISEESAQLQQSTQLQQSPRQGGTS